MLVAFLFSSFLALLIAFVYASLALNFWLAVFLLLLLALNWAALLVGASGGFDRPNQYPDPQETAFLKKYYEERRKKEG